MVRLTCLLSGLLNLAVFASVQDGVDNTATNKLIDMLGMDAIPAPVAAKPGDLAGVHAETEIVFLPKRPFARSVMSTFLDGNNNPVPR